MVYAWNIADDNKRVFYALTYQEAENLLRKGTKGTDHTKTDSWTKKGVYHFKVGAEWRKVLEQYKISDSVRWKEKIRKVSKLEASSHVLVASVKE
jgi:hypothetical protein